VEASVYLGSSSKGGGKMHIVLTGCGGYIGSQLLPYLLNKKHHIVGIDSLIYNNGNAISWLLGNNQFEFYKNDIRDSSFIPKIIKRADVVIHTAAIVGAPACDRNPHGALSTNDEASRIIAKSLSKNQFAVYLTTNSGYGLGGKNECTENDSLHPVSLYARTKVAAENYFSDRENSTCLRLATVFGTSLRMRFDLMVNDFVYKLKTGSLDVFEGHFRRNFIHILDVCRAINHCLENMLVGIYNVGLDTANMTKRDLAAVICDTLFLSPKKIVYGSGKDEDIRDYIVSSNKIKSTGFICKYSLLDGIKAISQMIDLLDRNSVLLMKN
jgi:nucleoside-diphosphate-sugar epimerase